MFKSTSFSLSSREAKLFLLGFLTLLLELILIRYLAGSIWNLGYFPNLVLIAVFVGMGVGFVFHNFVPESISQWLYMCAPYSLLFLVMFVHATHPVIPGVNGWSNSVGGELYFSSGLAKTNVISYLLFPFWFFSIVLIFILISQRTAKIFSLFSPLKAYTLDIAGSCCGIICFIIASWLHVPAYGWFLLLIPLFISAFDRTSLFKRVLFYVPLIAVVFIVCYQDTYYFARPGNYEFHKTIWSPYQRVDYISSGDTYKEIAVNGIIHQVLFDAGTLEKTFYRLPYVTRKQSGLPAYDKVLIIGAGSGNDVASALHYGAGHIDAVEIDPVIAELGRKYHSLAPYQNGAVTVTIDDGRSFMTHTKQKYDLIIFALTDSLIKTSPLAQLRLENYLFTKESVQRACSLLNKNGDIFFYNYYRKQWLIDKMYAMITQASGTPPVIVEREKDFVIFKTQSLKSSIRGNAPLHATVDIPTDDWPFLYLQKKGIPGIYITSMIGIASLVIILMIVLTIVSRKRADPENAPGVLATKIAFIVMGMAFLLLETKSVVQFSLLFGTTWLNSSLVFLCILILVLAANWIAQFAKRKYVLSGAYLLLLASCLITLLYPLSNLLYYDNRVIRLAMASLLLFSPIFFANVMFSILFSGQTTAENYLGWNLFGATLGGVMEYFSMALGYNMLTVIVAVCYSCVFLFLVCSKSSVRVTTTNEGVYNKENLLGSIP